MKENSYIYSREFYENRNALTDYSAKVIITQLSKYLKNVNSVADIGGGIGTFLRNASEIWGVNSKNLILCDGEYVQLDLLQVPKDCFAARNLEEGINISSKVDLAITLEVAEHLSPTRAESFVEELCSLSEVILFSAAAKGQGGEHHVNERELSYWEKLFEMRGYRAFDCIRPAIQEDKKIPFWYRQNIVLFVKSNNPLVDIIQESNDYLPPLSMVSYDMIKDRMIAMDTFGKTIMFRVMYKIYRLCHKRKMNEQIHYWNELMAKKQ